jgi:hypothetical protein
MLSNHEQEAQMPNYNADDFDRFDKMFNVHRPIDPMDPMPLYTFYLQGAVIVGAMVGTVVMLKFIQHIEGNESPFTILAAFIFSICMGLCFGAVLGLFWPAVLVCFAFYGLNSIKGRSRRA